MSLQAMEATGGLPPEPAGSAAWCVWRLNQNEESLRRFRQELGTAAGNPLELPSLNLAVEPGLVRPGERVAITFRTAAVQPPVGTAVLQADYLAAAPGRKEMLELDWRPQPGGGWGAVHEVRPETPGNWRVTWSVGSDLLTRVFGVAVPGRLVVTLWVGSNTPRLDEEIHRYDLPGDTWIGDWWSPFDRPLAQVVEDISFFARCRFRYGDRAVPFVNAGFILPGINNMNLFLLPPSVQAQGFRQVRDVWDLLGLGPMELFGSYTPGHATGPLLGELGVKALTSLCLWQNIQDGAGEKAWLINHMGAPNAPYYPARDDFRKVADGQAPLLAFGMGTSSDVRCYDFIAFDGCPTNCMPSQRYNENNAIAVNTHRFFLVADGWVNDARHTPDLLFVTTALENFRRSEHWRDANNQAAAYLVRRAAEGHVVFASAADIADFYRRHYPAQPEQTHYWADGYAGLRHGNKPACLPDRIEVSNDRFHSLHRDGALLPQLLWDYTVPWQNPEWAERTDVRDYRHGYGLIPPERIACTVNPEASCPREADLRGVHAEIAVAAAPDGLTLRVRVKTPRLLNTLPLALWRLPLAGIDRVAVEVSGEVKARFKTMGDGWTGNLHGLLSLHPVPAPGTDVVVRLYGTPRAPVCMEFVLDGRIGLRTYRTAEGPRTYFWRLDGVESCRLAAQVPVGVHAEVVRNDGVAITPDGQGRIEMDLGGDWSCESPCLVGAETSLTGGVVDVTAVSTVKKT